jgi:2-hydroxychromene-2-carboxylate isomerase
MNGQAAVGKISWVFDVISPFAYLGMRQLRQLPDEIEVRFVPVLLAALLEHNGQLGPAEIPAKRRFTYRFALWRARKMGIPMRFPPAHPFNPLAALRLIIAAGSSRRAVETVFDAVFLEGRDVADAGVVAALAHQLGIGDPGVMSAPAVKARLRDNTDWAIAQHVFGVPTFVIDEELFWGHDAFDMVMDRLREPAQFQDAEMSRLDGLPVGVARLTKAQ